MDNTQIKAQIDVLTEELKQHNHRYYVLAAPTISDQEFDLKLKELQALEEKHPEYQRPDSPTLRVGGAITKNFDSFRHVRPMLSLQNTYSREEVEDWHTQISKLADERPFTYIVQHKFDGVSLSLHYDNDQLVRGVTRGDGVQGDDITTNVKTIPTVRLGVNPGDHPDSFEVRGEVLMHKDRFQQLNANREKRGEPVLMNPRNATAGTLKMQDSAVVASRPLTFYAYWMGADAGLPDLDSEQQSMLQDMGFLAKHND